MSTSAIMHESRTEIRLNLRTEVRAIPGLRIQTWSTLVLCSMEFPKTRATRPSHHLATFTLKVTVLVPPAFLMTNLYCPSFSGVNLTEHFGPDESSLATSAPVES